MTNVVQDCDFSNHHFFVGIDVHRKSWKVTVRTAYHELATFSADPSPEALARHMRRTYPQGTYHSVYEAGFSGFWIHEELKALGIDTCVVHPADVPTTGKERAFKTDKRDSRKLARELASGSLKPLYVPSEEAQALRSLSRLRQKMVSHQTRLKNRIKGLCYFYGHHLPPHHELAHWSRRFITHLEEMAARFEDERRLVFTHLLEELDAVRVRKLQLIRELRQALYERAPGVMASLLSVPGVGFVTAATLYCELIDIERFSSRDKLCSYVGLVPSTADSGPRTRHGGITVRHNTYVRAMLIEASWTAVRKDPALTEAFLDLAQRMPRNQAIIRIARKLLNRIRHVWKNGCRYEVSVKAGSPLSPPVPA